MHVHTHAHTHTHIHTLIHMLAMHVCACACACMCLCVCVDDQRNTVAAAWSQPGFVKGLVRKIEELLMTNDCSVSGIEPLLVKAQYNALDSASTGASVRQSVLLCVQQIG